MNIRAANSKPDVIGALRASERAFTLPEILIASTILLLVVAGILSAHLFGMRMLQVNSTKLAATNWSRTTFGKMADEVHACNQVYIGYVTNAGGGDIPTNGFTANNFVRFMVGDVQQGNGLEIFPTTNTSNYIIYFLNPANQTFSRVTQNPNDQFTLASSVTNTIIFTGQDYFGNVISNLSFSTNGSRMIIHVALDIYQPQHFLQDPDFYQLETSLIQRVSQ